MSRSWDDMIGRLSNAEAAIESIRSEMSDTAYSGMAIRKDSELDTRIDTVGRVVLTVPLNLWQPAGSSGETLVVKTADQNNIGSSFADVTELGFTVEANTNYAFAWYLICTSDAITTGIDVACNGPAAPTDLNYTQRYWTGPSAQTDRGATAYNNDTAAAASNGTDERIFVVEGILRNGANAGTLIARIKREAVGSGPNVLAGSYGTLRVLA